MAKRLELTGQRFGRLTVSGFAGVNKRKTTLWVCSCDCGGTVTVVGTSLVSGNTKSCGCIGREKTTRRNTTHGKRYTRLYTIWSGMRQRCNYKYNKCYNQYGGRGIKVYSDWKSFQNFYNWSVKNGYRDGLSIDRIDNDKGYSPDNCRWVTPIEQAHNKRNVKEITYNGETHCLTEWARITGKCRKTISYRLAHGYSTEQALWGGRYEPKN